MSLSHGMDPVDAVRCLSTISGCSGEGDIVHSAAKELDFQPLALACAAEYVRHVRTADPTMTWDMYFQLIKNGNRESTERFYEKTNKLAYGKSMTTAVTMAVKKLTEESKVMFHAFEFLAALAPEFISLDHVVNYVMKCMPDEDTQSVKAEIMNSSLVLTWNDKDERHVRVHQVVFCALQSIMEALHATEERELSYLTKVTVVFSNFKGNYANSTKHITSTGILVSHFVKLFLKIKRFFERHEILLWTEKSKYGVHYYINRKKARQYTGPLVELMWYVLSRVLRGHGKYDFSRILLEMCIAITGHCNLGKGSVLSFSYVNNEQLTGMLNDLGRVLNQMGEYREAKMCYEKAIHLNKRMYGSNNAVISTNLNGLGEVLRNLSEYQEGLKCFERALVIDKNINGSYHYSVAITFNNLGLVLRDLGRYKEARKCYEKSLEISARIRETSQPDVAISLGNLATVLRGLGKYEDSKDCCEKALSIQKKVYGENHHYTGICQYFLGLSLHGLGDYQNAKHYFDRSVTTLEDALGKDHPQVAKTLNALGQLQLEQGDNEQAKLNLDRALAINEAHFKETHSQIAVTLNNLGRLCENSNQHVEARRYFERALAINDKTFDKNHPEIAITLNNLGNVLVKMKEEKEGNHCLRKALAIKEKNPDYAFKF